MIIHIFFTTLAVGALYGGAYLLVRGAAGIARALGVRSLVIGLTIVAFANSMPEFIVSAEAAIEGTRAIAVGNVVGSNIANLALILGVVALVEPIRVELRLLRTDVPILVVVTAFVAVLLWLELLMRPMGFVLLLALVFYLWNSVRIARTVGGREVEVRERWAAREEVTTPRLAWSMTIGGLGLLVFGAQVLIRTAMIVSAELGVEDVVVGMSIVALGTSLPELATAVVAAIEREGDIAIGQLVGSSIFNLLGVLGMAAIIIPVGDADVRLWHLAVLLALTVIVLPFMRSGFSVGRAEGALLASVYGGFLIALYMM